MRSCAPLFFSREGTGFLLNPAALGGVDGQVFPTPKPATYSEEPACCAGPPAGHPVHPRAATGPLSPPPLVMRGSDG
jgi:hypothetical protein